MPLSTLMKAHRSIRDTSPTSTSSIPSSEAGPSKSHRRITQIKAQLAELQHQKGRALLVKDESQESYDSDNSEEGGAERRKRDSKHAYVGTCTFVALTIVIKSHRN